MTKCIKLLGRKEVRSANPYFLCNVVARRGCIRGVSKKHFAKARGLASVTCAIEEAK